MLTGIQRTLGGSFGTVSMVKPLGTGRVGVSVAVIFQASCAGKSSAWGTARGLGGWISHHFFLGKEGDSVGRCWEIRISVHFSQFQSMS